MTVSAARWTSRCHASMTHPVNRYASGCAAPVRRVRNDRSESFGNPNRRGTRRRRCAEPERPREREQQPVTRQHHDVAQPLGDATQRAPRRGGRVRERLARALHEVAERHARRAGDLAAAALHAGLHRAPERVVDRRAVELDRAHGGDAPARRRGLEAGDAVGRAVRQAEPARDARDQLLLVDREHVTGRLAMLDVDGSVIHRRSHRRPDRQPRRELEGRTRTGPR